jgi:hypothetical protein
MQSVEERNLNVVVSNRVPKKVFKWFEEMIIHM